tara:strand:- start:511 stop:1878 length:1368 start_codon:yes stop_codon:yes gene_type:complete
MKISKQLSIMFLALMGCINLNAQDNKDEVSDTASAKLPLSYTIGTGVFNYRGDVGQVESIGTTENFEIGFSAGAEYTLAKTFGVGLTGFYGNISKNERNKSENKNFKTNLIGLNLEGTFHFANGFILSENNRIDPFISAGISFIKFNPLTDSLDAEGNTYNYWRDGSIRDINESNINANSAVIISRDYEYESEIKPNGEKLTAISIPVAIGFNFTINSYLSAQLKQTIQFTMSDFMDGEVGGEANDRISFTNLGLTFKPAGYTKRKNSGKDEFDDIDFVSILKTDTDADGILDIDDWCQETDQDVKVDKHGCPVDKDNDGISDDKDDEDDTNETALKIDSSGVAIPDSIVAKEALDTVVTLREELCAYYPSICQGDETDIIFQLLNSGKADKNLLSAKVEISKRPIEEIMIQSDLNKDGKIHAKEIYETIDLFFDGKVDLTLGDIHKLIDYFFEQ